ncbi:MAG: hypothetical protein AAF629_15895 [Chloroflexota bacterium]
MEQRTPDTDFKIFCAIVFFLILPMILTLGTVNVPREFVTAENSSPYGYTWSLTIFILPVIAFATWFIRHPKFHVQRKAFWFTIIIYTIAGLVLDIGLGNTFFTFPNADATLRIHLPGWSFEQGRFLFNVPIEEFGFYFFGSLFMLLCYIWLDLYWFGAYSLDRELESQKLEKLVSPHLHSAVWAVVLIVLGFIYKKLGPHPEGFPGYFTILVIGYAGPAFVFFRVVKPFVNWRAFSITLTTMWMLSLVYEATLGLPYQWWGYKTEQMLGLFIGGWTNLPIEEPLLWSAAGWGMVLVYELAQIWLHKRQQQTVAPA